MPTKRPLIYKYPLKAFPSMSALYLLSAIIGLIAAIILPASECWALKPNEIIVIANRNVQESVSLATLYMKKRGIPHKNLVVISATDKENCTREEYEKNVVLPIREFLHKEDPQKVNYRCILTMYGIPLIVDDGLDMKEKMTLMVLEERVRKLRERRKQLKKEEKDKHKILTAEMDQINNRISSLKLSDRTASVDSELALIGEKMYPRAGWVPNPAYLGYRYQRPRNMPSGAYLISRLDGPSPDIVRRVIEDSLTAEEKGIRGKAYFDARWPDPGNKNLSGYAFYDRALHRTANMIRKSGIMPVVLDENERLFQAGECPDAALYCGWYSLAKYVNAFKWVTGAVAYHIASAECSTLKKSSSTVWCKALLENGVAATIGPVGEPYIQAFPPPNIFFGLLIDGRLTLAECFALSSPFLSWKMVLIGDPLYRPFKRIKPISSAMSEN